MTFQGRSAARRKVAERLLPGPHVSVLFACLLNKRRAGPGSCGAGCDMPGHRDTAEQSQADSSAALDAHALPALSMHGS